jgi:hypothetical protein
MLNTITSKVYQATIVGLLLVIVGMGVNTWLDSQTITTLGTDVSALKKELKEEQGKLVLSRANEQVLTASVNSQNKEVEGLRIDLDKAKKQYRIEEKRIYETIYSERVVLKDLNDSEDWNNTKRIVDEIINLKL